MERSSWAARPSREPILYLDRENPLEVVKRNLDGLGIRPSRDLHLWGGWHTAPAPGPSEDHRMLFRFRPSLPASAGHGDSLVLFHTGDEQSAKQTSYFMNQLLLLADDGANILLLHHTGKSDGSKLYRGSSTILRLLWIWLTYFQGTPKDGLIDRLTLKNFKSRFASGQDFGLQFQQGR